MIASSCIAALVCGLVAMMLMFLLSGEEARTSIGDSQSSNLLLFCVSSDPVRPFFISSKASTVEHELKYFFKDDKISEISYNYKGGFGSKAEAESELSLMNFKYNTYMGGTQIYQEDLTPVFMVLDVNATINLFITRNDFTSEIAPLVFLEQENFAKVYKASAEEVKSVYEGLGFSCNLNE